MRLLRPGGIRARRPVGVKFAAAAGALVIGVLSATATAEVGMSRLNADVTRLIDDNVATIRAIEDLTTALHDIQKTAILELTGVLSGARRGQDATVETVLVPRARDRLGTVRRITPDEAAAGPRLTAIDDDLDTFLLLRRSAAARLAGPGGGAVAADLVGRISALFDRMLGYAGQVHADQEEEAAESGRNAASTYRSSRARLLTGAAASLVVALLAVMLLIRNLVPRIREYARFAGQIASGRGADQLAVRGTDELADLGRALNHMVARNEATRLSDADQAELAGTLQVTSSEDEAHELLQRHVERSLPGAAAVVLTRNNSENRLEAATALAPGSSLAARLPGAEPRACLALRFGRTHREQPGRPPLLGCALCADPGARSTCEPLLVGGQVIGSVLVTHPDRLQPADEALIRTSVAQAAPVVGNLRNLALAEFRANNDLLTGLPNKRATDDTLKRMVAQANRSITALAALMLDLDHFKQVNDQFGHAKGDEVLAAVGAAVRSCLRSSDFAGRIGGEELLVLLPDTTAEGAVMVAEKLRSTIAALQVPGVERDITVSIGIADLIQHGGHAAGLLRQADRALYAAKAAGRNQVVVSPPPGAARTGTPAAAWTGMPGSTRSRTGRPAEQPADQPADRADPADAAPATP